MFGCSTTCPKCKHEFTCCPRVPGGSGATGCSVANRRSLHALSGGGLIGGIPPTQPSQPLVSPSLPLAFVLPFPPHLQNGCTEPRPETELHRLQESVRVLKESGWYHEGVSWQQSQTLLKGTEPGTFLIRDSSDPRFLYALSVQTEQGPISVRLHYVQGKFRLDSEPHLAPLMPLFNSVVELVAYYVNCYKSAVASLGLNTSASGGHVWVDTNGCMFSRVLLKRPLLRSDRVPRLQHIARLAIHKALEASTRPRLALLPPAHTQLELPTRLVDYLAEYPYSL